jgi:hypothetical protein
MSASNPFADRVLNRVPRYDYRNLRLADYITPAMRARAAVMVNRVWYLDMISDQGNTPHCVGFGWLNYGNCEPIDDNWLNDRGHELYYKAKEFDGEPGAENGSSTLSGVKAFKAFGFLEGDQYAFATDIEDIKVWVLDQSPVVVGTNWYDSMFYPDSRGVVTVDGNIAGGHEYLIIGYDRETDMFLCANSWGQSFGINGSFSISAFDFARLMREEGDACTAVEVTAPVPDPVPDPVPTPTPTPAPGCLPAANLLFKLYKLAGGQ